MTLLLYIYFIGKHHVKSTILFSLVVPGASIACPILGIASIVCTNLVPYYIIFNLYSVLNWIMAIITSINSGKDILWVLIANVVCKIFSSILAGIYEGHIASPTYKQKMQTLHRTQRKLSTVNEEMTVIREYKG